jgi:hypothetical protein
MLSMILRRRQVRLLSWLGASEVVILINEVRGLHTAWVGHYCCKKIVTLIAQQNILPNGRGKGFFDGFDSSFMIIDSPPYLQQPRCYWLVSW